MATKPKANNKAITESTSFSVTGSFNPTDFRFHQASSAEVAEKLSDLSKVRACDFRTLKPVVLQTNQGYRGTNSVDLSDKDKNSPEKLAERAAPNLGARDCAFLDADKNMLVVVGSLKFVEHYSRPAMCDNPSYAEYHREFVRSYLADGHMPALMRRYLENIVSAEVLWRNKYGLSRTAVVTFCTVGEPDQTFVMKSLKDAEFERLVSVVSAAAQKPGSYFFLEVALIVELGADAEVFPSQLFVQAADKNKMRGLSDKASYGRLFASREASTGDKQVILSSAKVGNALRRVDWGYAEDAQEPIAVELYGAVTTQRVAYRLENKNSYFDLVRTKRYADMTLEERHYIMAVFIKGGLLGFAQSDKKSAKSEDAAVAEDVA